MEITIPAGEDLALRITDQPDERADYPTSRLSKGLVLSYRGLDLAEEAVGFGVPLLKQGLVTIFPGELRLQFLNGDRTRTVTADYSLNLVERMRGQDKRKIESALFYAVKDSLSGLMRDAPSTRGALTALSSGLRGLSGWQTSYEQADFSIPVKMTYRWDEKMRVLGIEAQAGGMPNGKRTELIVMNEQGAHYFDKYDDSSGKHLSGSEIGLWEEVAAEEAWFSSSTQPAAFRVHQVPAARLFRGRELIGSRLAWSGFGYSSPVTGKTFNCTIKLGGTS